MAETVTRSQLERRPSLARLENPLARALVGLIIENDRHAIGQLSDRCLMRHAGCLLRRTPDVGTSLKALLRRQLDFTGRTEPPHSPAFPVLSGATKYFLERKSGTGRRKTMTRKNAGAFRVLTQRPSDPRAVLGGLLRLPDTATETVAAELNLGARQCWQAHHMVPAGERYTEAAAVQSQYYACMRDGGNRSDNRVLQRGYLLDSERPAYSEMDELDARRMLHSRVTSSGARHYSLLRSIFASAVPNDEQCNTTDFAGRMADVIARLVRGDTTVLNLS